MEEVLNGYVTNQKPIPTLTHDLNRNPNSNSNPNPIYKKIEISGCIKITEQI
jgi:hypothetical protein